MERLSAYLCMRAKILTSVSGKAMHCGSKTLTRHVIHTYSTCVHAYMRIKVEFIFFSLSLDRWRECWMNLRTGLKTQIIKKFGIIMDSTDTFWQTWSVCIHIYIHTYIHTYIHAYIHTYCTYMCVTIICCTFAYSNENIQIFACLYAHSSLKTSKGS